MSINRIKLPSTVITRARAEEILGEIATLTLGVREYKTAMDQTLTKVREEYQPLIAMNEKDIEEKTALLESWASANPAEFPKDRKSIALLHGVLGYRTGTPKLKNLAKWTWESVLGAIKALENLPQAWVRVKEEINKEAVLASYAQGFALDSDLRQLGMKVTQEESFFVEPKMEETKARTVKQVAA